MEAASATRDEFRHALVVWSLVFWAAIYALLTARSLVMRPDLPMLNLAGLRIFMIPVGLAVCVALFVLLERIQRLESWRKAAALAVVLAFATAVYFTVNYYVFHRFPEHGVSAPGATVKILSYLIEFFWIFPAWVLLYLFLRRRAAGSTTAPAFAARDGIWIRDRASRIFVPVNTIRWVEAERDYVRIHTEYGSHLVRWTMAALERELSAFGLVRIHRRVIAPARAMTSVRRLRSGRVELTLDDGTKLPVGRTYLHRLNGALAGTADHD